VTDEPHRVVEFEVVPSQPGRPPDETDDAALVGRRLGLPDGTRIIRMTADAGQFAALAQGLWLFQVGVPADWDWATGDEPPWWWTLSPEADGTLLTVRYLLLRLVLPGTPLAYERHFPPSPHAQLGTVLRGNDELYTREQLLQIWRAKPVLGLYERARRGPGSGAGARYASPEAWYGAIRNKVLTKLTRLTADDATIAFWLGISTSTMYTLMSRWGPRTLEALRNGRF
jgi:hypothetical protein